MDEKVLLKVSEARPGNACRELRPLPEQHQKRLTNRSPARLAPRRSLYFCYPQNVCVERRPRCSRASPQPRVSAEFTFLQPRARPAAVRGLARLSRSSRPRGRSPEEPPAPARPASPRRRGAPSGRRLPARRLRAAPSAQRRKLRRAGGSSAGAGGAGGRLLPGAGRAWARAAARAALRGAAVSAGGCGRARRRLLRGAAGEFPADTHGGAGPRGRRVS